MCKPLGVMGVPDTRTEDGYDVQTLDDKSNRGGDPVLVPGYLRSIVPNNTCILAPVFPRNSSFTILCLPSWLIGVYPVDACTRASIYSRVNCGPWGGFILVETLVLPGTAGDNATGGGSS